MRLLGEIARNRGLNWSPLEMLTGITVYGREHSSSMIVIFQPLGVAREYGSMGFVLVACPAGLGDGEARRALRTRAFFWRGFAVLRAMGRLPRRQDVV